MHTCTQALQRQLRLRRQWKSHKWEREAEEGSDGERTQANSGAGSSSSPVERSDVQSFDRAAAFDGGGRGGGEVREGKGAAPAASSDAELLQKWSEVISKGMARCACVCLVMCMYVFGYVHVCLVMCMCVFGYVCVSLVKRVCVCFVMCV
jgi:hypothetical protein